MRISVLRVLLFSFVFGIFVFAAPHSLFAQNSINGMIFDHNRRPVPNVDVELLDEFERLIASSRARGSGFYSFQRLTRGIYYINIRVGGTGFKKKRIRIDLGTGTASSVEVKQIDVHLELDKKKAGNVPAKTGVIFVQNIPPDAKEAYQKAINSMGKKDAQTASTELAKAITIFPEYYDALLQLGKIYLNLSKFTEAENIFSKAAEVNPKSFSSFFGLGIAHHNLKKRRAAIKSLKRANEIDANSINSHLLLGIVQRDAKMAKNAEKSFLKAKKLSENREPDVHWNLALLYYHEFKRYTKAADELELYIKALPKNKNTELDDKISKVKKLIQTFRQKARSSS